MKTKDELLDLAQAEAEGLEDLDAEIALAVLEERSTTELQRKRNAATERVRQFELAAREAERAELEANAEFERAEDARRAKEARAAFEALRARARDVDQALGAVDSAWGAYELALLDAQRATRGADGGRMSNTSGPAARWALAHHAVGFATAVGAPRVPANRRRAFGESVAAMLPRTE